tara:strand:- start:698 stop:1015 length:318 start_codon:yes stop_codon:yes gene_type:complete
MSGSGGGGYIPSQRTKFDCKTGIIITSVSSINVTVLAKHRIGSILDVIIGKNEELLLEDGDGEILGALLHSNTPDIIGCINEGADYEAEIERINIPVCTVKITRK